jgi:hypothetical protein
MKSFYEFFSRPKEDLHSEHLRKEGANPIPQENLYSQHLKEEVANTPPRSLIF